MDQPRTKVLKRAKMAPFPSMRSRRIDIRLQTPQRKMPTFWRVLNRQGENCTHFGAF